MPSTYSPLLRFEAPAPGEQSGSWGNVLNLFFQLAEQSITGISYVQMPSDADYTLSVASGSPDEARRATLVVQSDVSLTAMRSIIVPSSAKTYLVLNLTTGGQWINVRTASGGGTTVAPGCSALVISYGGGAVARVAPNYNLTDDSVLATEYRRASGGLLLPTGVMLPFGGWAAPSGYMLCDGAAVSRSTYAALFSVLGTTWGSGDGSTTFNLPDMRGRGFAGSDDGTGRLSGFGVGSYGGAQSVALTAAQLAAHAHGINDPGHSHGVNDPGHAHGVNDPGHSHSVNLKNDGGQGHGSLTPAVAEYGAGNTGGSGTGISIAVSGTGIFLSGSGTGISVQNAGNGDAHSNVQPTAAGKWIIKY